MKNAINIFLLIYAAEKEEYFMTFDDIVQKSTLNENTLRRITNSLSRNGIIRCVRDERAKDRRRKIYKCNKDIARIVLELQK